MLSPTLELYIILKYAARAFENLYYSPVQSKALLFKFQK